MGFLAFLNVLTICYLFNSFWLQPSRSCLDPVWILELNMQHWSLIPVCDIQESLIPTGNILVVSALVERERHTTMLCENLSWDPTQECILLLLSFVRVYVVHYPSLYSGQHPSLGKGRAARIRAPLPSLSLQGCSIMKKIIIKIILVNIEISIIQTIIFQYETWCIYS